jgi:nucleoside-diphosphate-sugar epimerase
MLGNLQGAHTLLEQLRMAGRGRLLFVSTGEIYGENPAITDGFSESDFGRVDSMNPRACYPESKRAAETLCASYTRQYGVDAVVARLSYVFGPTLSDRNTRADAQFLRKALAGEDIVLKSAGAQVRSYCYVTDAVCALITLLLAGENGQAYNVASNDSVHSIREYAETLADLAGVGLTFDLPPEAERQGYSAVTRAVQNPAKLEMLGWRAKNTLVQGLSRTLEILK